MRILTAAPGVNARQRADDYEARRAAFHGALTAAVGALARCDPAFANGVIPALLPFKLGAARGTTRCAWPMIADRRRRSDGDSCDSMRPP